MIVLAAISLWIFLFALDVLTNAVHDRWHRSHQQLYDWPYHWFGIVTWDEPPIWIPWSDNVWTWWVFITFLLVGELVIEGGL